MSNAQITYLCFPSRWDLNPFGPEYLDSYLISSNWFSFEGVEILQSLSRSQWQEWVTAR